jgi:hypothetical protein
MSISVRIAGRLLKSAVVFQMQTHLLLALPVRAKIPIDYYPNSFRNHLDNLLKVPPGTPVAAVAVVVPVVPVTINLI